MRVCDDNRHKGYVQALQEAGIAYDPDKVIWFYTEDRKTHPFERIRQMARDRGNHPFEAVVASAFIADSTCAGVSVGVRAR